LIGFDSVLVMNWFFGLCFLAIIVWSQSVALLITYWSLHGRWSCNPLLLVWVYTTWRLMRTHQWLVNKYLYMKLWIFCWFYWLFAFFFGFLVKLMHLHILRNELMVIWWVYSFSLFSCVVSVCWWNLAGYHALLWH